MLREQIDQMIMSARKADRKDTLLVYQAIKDQFLKFKTAKNAGTLDDNAEMQILRKMIKERQQSYDIYASAGRDDLADKEAFEIKAISELLPEEPTEEDYNRLIDEYISGLGDIEFDRSQMGKCIKYVKEKLTGADGKLLSQLVVKRFA